MNLNIHNTNLQELGKQLLKHRADANTETETEMDSSTGRDSLDNSCGVAMTGYENV
jgi:hypothetical protein